MKGGLARIREYLSRSVFWSDRLSRYWMVGLSTPWAIMFMAPMRSMVRSIRELVENHRLEAVISMPSGVFKPYAGVSTGPWRWSPCPDCR